jgi:hypothetical protein
MGQEVSVSYQAVKSRVYRLIDALVEGSKTEEDVQASVRRWWKLVHPADRPMAQKYLLMVLQKSNATLEAITDGLSEVQEPPTRSLSDRPPRMRAVTGQSQVTSPM